MKKPMMVCVLGVVSLMVALCSMNAGAQALQVLTDQDKSEIQALVTGYARALGNCAASEYADLFAPDMGYFASGFRGQVAGRVRLIAMVQSERQCINSAGAAQTNRPV